MKKSPLLLVVLALVSCARNRSAVDTAGPAWAGPLLASFAAGKDIQSTGDAERVELEAVAVKIVSHGSDMVGPILRDIKSDDNPVRRTALIKLLRIINDRTAQEAGSVSESSRMIEATGRELLKSAKPADRRTGAVLLALPARSQLVPAALKLLDDADLANRDFAGSVLREIADLDLGYNPNASAADRAPAVKRWHEWWAKNEDRGFYYMPNSNPVLSALVVEADRIAGQAGPYELRVSDAAGAPLPLAVVMYSYRFTTFDGKGTSVEERSATDNDGRILLGAERTAPGMRFTGGQVIVSKSGYREAVISISPHLLTPNSFSMSVTLEPGKK